MNEIFFCSEDTPYSFSDQSKHIDWINGFIKRHNRECGTLTYIFCSDVYLLGINKQHLNHDYFTDVITFNYGEENTVSGDVFISIDRVNENSNDFHSSFEDELRRVMAHGVLHLIGFNDKTKIEKDRMRNEENRCLESYKLLK